MSEQYNFLKSILSVLKDNEFLAVWEFLESEASQNNWFAIVLIIFLGIVFEMVCIKICTYLQRKPALSEKRTPKSQESEDCSSLGSMTFDNSSIDSSIEERTDDSSERTMTSLICFPLIVKRNEGPFEDRAPYQDKTPLFSSYSPSSESKYHVSYFSESHVSSIGRRNSSLSMIQSEVKKIFLNHRDHPEKEQETVQFSSKKLFSILKTKNPDTLMYSSNYKLTSTISQENETPNVTPCPFAHLFLTRDQIRLLEENVRNQISFKSQVTIEGKISYLLSKSQESLIQKQHSVQVGTFAEAQNSFPGHKMIKNQSFYEAKLICRRQQFVDNQESISSQHDAEAKCVVLPQDVEKKPFCSSMQESSQVRDVDRSLHLTDTSCSVECQDLMKILESDKKHLDDSRSSVWFQDSNKFEESTQNPATKCKNAKHLVSDVMPCLVAQGMPQLKSIKVKDQPQIASSKLRQDSPYHSVPLFLTIKRQKRKALSSVALYLISVSKPVLPYIKKYSKKNLGKVVLGLIICKDFFIKQNKSPDVEKVKSSHSIERTGALGNTVKTKQHFRNIKRLKHISPKVSLQIEQSLLVNTELNAPCSSTETNWNDKESLRDPLTQANKIDIAEFHAPSNKETSGQHDLEYETFLNEMISQLIEKLISSFKIESNRRLNIMKVLKSLKNSHLLVSNGEKVPTSKPDSESCFTKGNIQKDFMKTALESVDINFFFSLGTKKHENSEQLACMKNKESTEDSILKETIPSILNITEYGNQNYRISESKELEDQTISNIKNTQSDAFHSVPYATICELPAMEMESRLKAKEDIIRTIGLSHSAHRQEENPNEKKIYVEERDRYEMPQLLDEEEEEQETILYCGGEEKVQEGEEEEQNSIAWHPPHLPLHLCHLESHRNTSDLEPGCLAQEPSINEQDAPHLTQEFTLGLQLQQKAKCVQPKAQQGSVEKRKNQEKESEVKLQTPHTQITWGTFPYPRKGSSQEGNVKSCTERSRSGKSADPKKPVTMLESIPIGEVSSEITECSAPLGGDSRKILGDAREKEDLSRVLSKAILESFVRHLFPSLYLKRQEIQNKLPGRQSVLRPKYVTVKAKEPAISLKPYSNRHGTPDHRERPRGNENILEQMLQYNKTDQSLNVIYPHKAILPHMRTHSSLNAETLSHRDPNQEKSLVDKEGKCSDFINTGSDSRRPLAVELQKVVRGDKEAAPREILQKSLNLRVNSYPKKKLRTEKELRHPTPPAEILTRPVYSDLANWAEVENTRSLMVETDFKDSVSLGMAPLGSNLKNSVSFGMALGSDFEDSVSTGTAPLASRKKLQTEEPLNPTRKGIEYSRSDTGEISSCLSTEADLAEQELDSSLETSDYCTPALLCSKMKTKKVRFLLTECPEGSKSIDKRTAVQPTHLQKFSTLARKNLELNPKTGFEKIKQANEPTYEFLSQLFSPRPSRLQGDTARCRHIPLKQGGQADEGRPRYVDFFLHGATFTDREEKVQPGEEEGGKAGSEAAPQGHLDAQINMNDQLENCPNTPEPEPGSLPWELPIKEHNVQDHAYWTRTTLETALQTFPRAPEGLQTTKTENHLLVSTDINIPLPRPGNGASLDKDLNTATEDYSPAFGKPERNLNFNFFPRTPELSHDLQVPFLQSSGSTKPNDLKYKKKKNILTLTRKQMFLRPRCKTWRSSASHMPEGRGTKELPGNFKRKSRNLELRKKVANIFLSIIHSKVSVLFTIKMNSKLNLETNREKRSSCNHMCLMQQTSPNGKRLCDPNFVDLSSFSNSMKARKQVEESNTLLSLDKSQGSLFDVCEKDHGLIKPHKEARQSQKTNTAEQMQTHLPPDILCSLSWPILYQFTLENTDSHARLLPPKSEEAKMNEMIFSLGQHDCPSDENDMKEQAGRTEKGETMSLGLSATKRKRNFKRNSDVNILANLSCGITKAKKPSIACVLRIQGGSSTKQRGKQTCSSEPKMKEVTPSINMADTMDSFVTVRPAISTDSKIDKGEKRLISKLREEVSPLDGDMISYSTNFKEEEDEESEKNIFNKIQHFTFQSGQRKKCDLDMSENQGSEKILLIIEQVLSKKVKPAKSKLVQKLETKHATPNDTMCSGSSRFPLLTSKELPLGQVLIGAGENSLPSDSSQAGERDNFGNMEKAEFKKDQQATMLECVDVSTSGLSELKMETLTHRTLKSEKSSRCVILKAKKAPVSRIFNIPRNGYLKKLPPKILASQSSDFFAYIKHSGVLEDLTAEKRMEGLLHQGPAAILESLGLPILSELELKRKRHNLKLILRTKKVNPKYIVLKTKTPIFQTFNITKRGTPSPTMQFKCNLKAMVHQGMSMVDIILDVLYSAIPISSDNQMKAETDVVQKTKSSSFQPQQEQSPDGEGTRGTDSREEKSSEHESSVLEDQAGKVDTQNDHPFHLNVSDVKVPHSVQSGLNLKDTLRKGEKNSGTKAVRTMPDDSFIGKTELNTTFDRGPIRTLDVDGEVSLLLENAIKSIKTKKVLKTDDQDTLYTASWNFIHTEPWSENSVKRMGYHFANRHKELQRDELKTSMVSKLDKSKGQTKSSKFLERKDIMGVRCKTRKAKMPLFSQILNIPESSHLYGRKKQESNSRSMIKGLQAKQRTAHAFSFLPLTSTDNKLDIKMHRALKTELDKPRVETGDSTHQELDKACDREALKANSTDPQKRSSNTMESSEQQEKEEENTPKLSSESILHDIQHSKSGVTNPGPCMLESEQSSEGRKTCPLLCQMEKVKQEEDIRESILKSVSRYLLDFSQIEKMGKHPHRQKGREGMANLKTPFSGKWKSEIHSVHEPPVDGDPRRKLDCPVSEKETWNQNKLVRTALKSSDFSSLHSTTPRSQGNSFEFRGKKSIIPKHVSLKVEKKLPVSQLPNITRYLTGSHCQVKQQKNECVRKALLCATEGVELPPSRLVSDELLHTTTKGTKYKRTLHKTLADHLTGEKAELGKLATTFLGPLDCHTSALSHSENQVNTVQENKVILDSIYLTMKEKGPPVSHMLNEKFASKHKNNFESHLGTSMKVMKIVKDVVDPVIKSICSALDIVDTAIQSKLHIEEVGTSSFSPVQPVKMEFPEERLLCSQSPNVTDPATLSFTMEQKQKIDIVRARTALNSDLQSTQTPIPIIQHQSSGSWDICEESSGRSSLHKAKVGEKEYEDQILFRTTVQCNTQPFEFGGNGRREFVPFKSEAHSIFIVRPKDNITPQTMDIDLADQEANTGVEEDICLEAAPFSEMHLLEIRGWKKTDKSANWKRLTNSKILIPKGKKSLPDTHFSNTTEFGGLLQPREEKEVTGQSMCLHVWRSMTDKASSKDIHVEYPSCAEGTGLLITGEGDQPEKCTSETLPKPASHSKVSQLQISIPQQQVKSHITNIYCEYSIPLAKKARRGIDIPLRSTDGYKKRLNLQSKEQNQQQPLFTPRKKTLGQNLPYSQNDSWILPHILSPIKETLAKVISEQRTNRSDLLPQNQLEIVYEHRWTAPEEINQNTGLHLGSGSETSNSKNILFPKEKLSLARVQAVHSLLNGNNSKQRIRKKRQSSKVYRKAQEQICLPRIFSYSLSIYKPVFLKSKKQKNNIRQRFNQGMICPRRRILKLKVMEVLHFSHSIDHGICSHWLDQQRNVTGEMVNMEHRKVKPDFIEANVHDFSHPSPLFKSNQENIDEIMSNNVGEIQKSLLLEKKDQVRESNMGGVKYPKVVLRTKKLSVLQHSGKHLPMILNTIKQEGIGQGGEDPSERKSTNMCPPIPLLSYSNLNSRIPERENKSGIPRFCLPPLTSQAFGSSRQTSSTEFINRDDLGNGIKSIHYFPRIKTENIPEMNDIMGLKCIAFKGKRTPFKHLFFRKEAWWNNKGKKKLMQKDEHNLDTWHKPHAYISSPHLEWGPEIKEVCMQGIMRSSHPMVTLRVVSATTGRCENPTNIIGDIMRIEEPVSQKDESTVERTLEEMSHLERIAKERMSPNTQVLELIKEKEKKMQKNPNKIEAMKKPCAFTSFPHYSEVNRRTKEVIVNTISSFLCPKLQDALKTPKITSVKSISGNRSTNVQNINRHIISEYKREKIPISLFEKKNTPAISHESQLAFQEQKKKTGKIKTEASMVLTNSTFVPAPSHLKPHTQTRKLDFLTDMIRFPLLKPPQRKTSAAVKKTSNRFTRASIADHVQEAKLCKLQGEENINARSKEGILYTKDEGSKMLYQHMPWKLQEQKRGDVSSRKYERKESKDEQEITLTTHWTSDSHAIHHEVDTSKEDVQGIAIGGISQQWLQTSLDVGKILHAKSNEDDVSVDVKTAQEHKPQNRDDGGDTVTMSYPMCSNGIISEAETFSLPQALGASGSCGSQITEEQTKIKDPLGYAQERKVKPDKVLTKAFLPQIKTTKGVDKDRGPIGSLLPSWHRSTGADQLIYTVSPLDENSGYSHRVRIITQEEADKTCILEKDQMSSTYPAKKTPLVSILLTKFLQANVKDQVKGGLICSRRKGVFQNKICSVVTSSTHLESTQKEEGASGPGVLMSSLEIKGPLPSGTLSEPVDKYAKEGKPHPPEGGKARREAKISNRQSKGSDLQANTSSLLPEYDIAVQGPLSRRNIFDVGIEEKVGLEQHRASGERDVILTKPCASQHTSKPRTEGGKDLLANTGFISQLQLHKPPSSGKINTDPLGGNDLCFSTRDAGHCVLHEKAEERVKTEGEGRLLPQVSALRAETCPLGHPPSKKVSSLNDMWQRRERQEAQGKPEVVQSKTFAAFSPHSYLKRNTKEDPLGRIKLSSPPFKSQDLLKSDNKACPKSLVDYRLKERERLRMVKNDKMPHKCMDPKAKKSSQAHRLNSRKLQWKIKELEQIVQENKNDLIVGLKNICTTLVTLPHIKLGSSEEGEYVIRITKYLHPPHLRTEEFSDVVKIAHLATIDQEPCSSVKELKEPTFQKNSQTREKTVTVKTVVDSKEMCLKTKESLMLLRSSQSNFLKTEEQEQKISEGQWEMSDIRLTNLYAPESSPLPMKMDSVGMGESIEIVTRFSVATVKIKELLDSKEAMHVVPMSFDILISPQTGTQGLAQRKPWERMERGHLQCSKHQEEKKQGSKAKPGDMNQSSLSAFSRSALHLDNKRQGDSMLVHEKIAMQRIASVEERTLTEPISPQSLEDGPTEKEPEPQVRRSSQERTAVVRCRLPVTQMAYKSRNLQHPFVRHRTEMHLNIGRREQRRCEDESQSCSKVLRKICVSQPSPKNPNLDKGTQIDAEMLGVQRPSIQPIVLLTLSPTEKIQAMGGVRKNEPCKFQKEKHKVQTVDLRVKMQPNFLRGSPISQILESKEFVLNIIEKKKDMAEARDEQCMVLTRTLISTLAEPTFYLDPGNRTDGQVPAKTRAFPPRYKLQKSAATQERAIGKSVERGGAIAIKKAQHPQTRQEAGQSQASHFTISVQGKNLPRANSEGKLMQLVLNPEDLYFTGCGTIRNGESLESFRIAPKPKEPSQAYKTPASTQVLSYPTRKPVTRDSLKKELEIKGTFNQKINPKVLFSSLRKMPLEMCVTLDTPASSKRFSGIDEPQDPLSKALPGSAKSCKHDKMKKDVQSYYQINKMLHPWTEGSLDKMSITGSSVPPNMENQVAVPMRRGLPCRREAKLVSSLYLKFPLQRGKQMTLSTMTVDMQTAGYPRCPKLSGTLMDMTEFDAHRRKDRPTLLVLEQKKFIFKSLQTSLCPCWSLSLGPEDLEGENKRKNGGNFKKNRSYTRKQKTLSQKAPSCPIPPKHTKEPKEPNSRQSIKPQKLSTKRVLGSLYPVIYLSPKCEDWEGRLPAAHVERESTPQWLTMKIPDHPILQLLGNVKELEFQSIQPKDITLWDENGTEIYIGNFYLSRGLAPPTDVATVAERHEEREKESCSLEPQKSPCASHTVWSVLSTEDHNLANILPGDSQPFGAQPQDTQNSPPVTSRADCSREGTEVLLASHTEDRAVPGHSASGLPKDCNSLVLQQEEKAAKVTPAPTVSPSTCEEPKKALEMQVTCQPISPPRAEDTGCGAQPGHTLECSALLKVQGQDTSPERALQPQPATGAAGLQHLHVERRERKVEGWRSQEDNSLLIMPSHVESHITTIQARASPNPKARDTCQPGAWKSPSSTEGPDRTSPAEARLQAKSISERFTPEGEMNLHRHVVSKTQEIHLNRIPKRVMRSLRKDAFCSKEVASEVPGTRAAPHRKVYCLRVDGMDTVELNLTHSGLGGAAPGSPWKSLIINFSDQSTQVLKLPTMTKPESSVSAPMASAIEGSWPPVLQKWPVEHRDNLLIHFARKTLEFQVKSFPRIVMASHMAAHTQERKPLSRCFHLDVQGPNPPNRILLFFDEKSLRQIDLDLQYKYFRFLLGFPVKRSLSKPKALPRYILKLNTDTACKNVNQLVQGGGLAIDRERAEKHFSFKNLSRLQNSLWIRKALKSVLVAASAPGGSRREQKDTTGVQELPHPVTVEKDKCGHVWFQERAASPGPRPQKNAAGAVKFQSAQPPEAFPRHKTHLKAAVTLTSVQSFSPEVQNSEECMVLEANSYLGQESESILYEVQNGIPLEKTKMKKMKMVMKPFSGDTLGPFQIWVCRRHSLAVTPPHPESHRGRKPQPSSKRYPSGRGPDMSLTPTDPSLKSSISCLQDKSLRTTRMKTNCSLAPLTESNLKLHLARSQGRSYWSYKSKDRKKTKIDLFRKSHGHQDCSLCNAPCQGERRRKKEEIYCKSESSYYFSSRKKSAWNSPGDPHIYCERNPGQPFVYACIPADSLQIVPQTVRWTIPPQTLKKSNFRAPLVAKVSNTCSLWGPRRKVLESFLDPFHAVHPD